MLRKLITVGTSTAVIIPKESLKKKKIRIGDMVDIVVEKSTKKKASVRMIDPEVTVWTNGFIESYRPLLKKLSKS